MFTHQVVIHRFDTEHPFWYDSKNVLTDSLYLSLRDQAINNGELISENYTISSDQLTAERTVVWASQGAFNAFFNNYKTAYPSYNEDFLAYCAAHNHIPVYTTN